VEKALAAAPQVVSAMPVVSSPVIVPPSMQKKEPREIVIGPIAAKNDTPVPVPSIASARNDIVNPSSDAPIKLQPFTKAKPSSRILRKRIIHGTLLTLLAAAVVAGAYFGIAYLRLPKDADFSIGYANPSGICFDQQSMWVVDWAAETIYKHHRNEKLSVAATFPISAPNGIAFDGKYIWSSHSFEQKIYKRDAATLSIVGSYASPGPSPSGIYFDGTFLWSLDFETGKVYKHNIDDALTVVGTFDSLAVNPSGIFGREGFLYISDSSSGRIYKFNIEGMTLAGIYTLAQYKDNKKHLSGIAWDGVSIWSCSDGVQKLYRHRLQSLIPIKFAAPAEKKTKKNY
jgi:sugar lactone lactonase YvrE